MDEKYEFVSLCFTSFVVLVVLKEIAELYCAARKQRRTRFVLFSEIAFYRTTGS